MDDDPMDDDPRRRGLRAASNNAPEDYQRTRPAGLNCATFVGYLTVGT